MDGINSTQINRTDCEGPTVKEFHTKAIVNAPARVVFEVLTNNENYARFDKNCRALKGTIEVGKKISFLSLQNRSRTFTILKVTPHELMIWHWTLPLGLLSCRRTFLVIAKDDFTSEFHIIEEIRGVFGIIFPGFVRELGDELRVFSSGLKRFIESRP